MLTNGGRSVPALLACLLALAGCAAAPTQGDDAQVEDVASMFTPDVESWVMPLDSFNQNLAAKGEVARQLVVGSCMGEAGYEYPAPAIDHRRTTTATQNSWEWRLFDEAIAQRWGYTQDPRYDVAAVREAGVEIETLAQAVPDVFQECLQRGNEIPASAETGVNPRALGAVAYKATVADPEVKAAVDRWKECMAPQGIPDLPDDLSAEMPTPSMLSRFGRPASTGPDSVAPQVEPNADEITVAVADAQCRESSLYTETFYQEEWDRELVSIAENLDALERYRDAQVEHSALLDRVIAENGG